MNLRKKLVFLALASMMVVLAGTRWIETEARATEDGSFDLAEITCWDALTLADEERNMVLFLLYGYHAGSTDQTVHTAQGIEQLLRSVGEYCADNPDVGALDAIRKASK